MTFVLGCQTNFHIDALAGRSFSAHPKIDVFAYKNNFSFARIINQKCKAPG
jgi:hypothetical protein